MVGVLSKAVDIRNSHRFGRRGNCLSNDRTQTRCDFLACGALPRVRISACTASSPGQSDEMRVAETLSLAIACEKRGACVGREPD